MRVFVTGSSGFIGRTLKAYHEGRLIPNPVNYDLNDITEHEFYWYKRGENVDVVKDFKPDVIIHAAGEIYKEEDMISSNIQLTHDLLIASKKVDYQAFICIGSSSEYGNKLEEMNERDLLEPESLYGATKASASLIAQSHAYEYCKPVVVARPFSLYGHLDNPHKMLPTLMRCHKNKEVFKLSPGIHDWVYIEDFLDGLFCIAENPITGDIINLGTGVATTNFDVVCRFEDIVGETVKTECADRQNRDYVSNWQADPDRARDCYGWWAIHSLKAGLARYVKEATA